MKKILIVDDEKINRDLLARRLLDIGGDFTEVGQAANGEDAIVFCKNNNVDIVLLDIDMPGQGGMKTAQQLRQLSYAPVIVFCTGHPEYAVSAFEVEAAGFVTKPIQRDKLKQALDIAASRVSKAQQNEQHPQNTLTIKNNRGIEKLALHDIIYCVAEQKYVTAIHKNGEAILDESLKQLEETFAHYFLRVHRNTLVAKDEVKAIKKDDEGALRVILKNHDFQPIVSRRHVSDVKGEF